MWFPVMASIECGQYIGNAIEELNAAKYQAELSHMDEKEIQRINLIIEILNGNKDDLVKGVSL